MVDSRGPKFNVYGKGTAPDYIIDNATAFEYVT